MGDVVSALFATKCFDLLSMKQDAREHSLELILPFLSYVFMRFHLDNDNEQEEKNENPFNKCVPVGWNKSFKIIPIMVGNCRKRRHELYGKILAPYFEDDATLFVISSDFCHWGSNYGYTPFDKESYAKGDI